MENPVKLPSSQALVRPITMQSQFALTLELANLVPKPSHLLQVARALQRSGSDLVAEEDFVAIFGRNQLSSRFESTFKTVIFASAQQTILSKWLPIIIEGGPGPTVQRAIKERAHFATVVQLSMLCWALDKTTLVDGLAQAMRSRMAGAGPGIEAGYVPGERAILAVLKSCQEQTSTFPWQFHFDAIRMSLGIKSTLSGLGGEDEVELPISILQAALDMLTAVQHLPEHRMMYVQSRRGVIIMVVWAHSVLGLTVSVRGSRLGTVLFGSGTASVVIDMGYEYSAEARASLLEATAIGSSFDPSKGLILAIDHSETSAIRAEVKYPARGYGTQILQSIVDNRGARYEMAHVAIAIAFCISRKIKIYRTARDKEEQPELHSSPPNLLSSKESNILTTSRFLFDGIELDVKLVREYDTAFIHQPLEELKMPPAVKQMLSEKPSEMDDNWWQLTHDAHALCLLILGLSAVGNLDECAQWPLGSLENVFNSSLGEETTGWNGTDFIPLFHDGWYDILSQMMFGSKVTDLSDTCLISNWGWSLYMSSFGDVDTKSIIPGSLTVKPGVPSREGERRTKVLDGPCDLSVVQNIKENEIGEDIIAKPSSQMHVIRQNDMIGTREDHFIVTVRFSDKDIYLTTGYREMHRVRWNSCLSTRCKHGSYRAQELPLPLATVWEIGSNQDLPRMVITQTDGSGAAGLMAMLTGDHVGREAIVLTDCCLNCVISQISTHESKCVIIY